jgi:hypothetical protein
MAAQEHMFLDPEGDILPSRKKAVYTTVPSTRKITRKRNHPIMQTLYNEEHLSNVMWKHNFSEAEISLHRFIKKHHIYLHPRCQTMPETATHILVWKEEEAIISRTKFRYDALLNLSKAETNNHNTIQYQVETLTNGILGGYGYNA